MKPREASRARWIYAAVGGAAAMVALLVLFRNPRFTTVVAASRGGATIPAVKLVNLKKNDALLTDPTPLFLPTEWNAAQDALPAEAGLRPGSSFAGYPPYLRFTSTELALEFPPDVVVPSGPADALSIGKPAPTFLGISSVEGSVVPLASRKSFVEITDARSGRKVLSQPLTDASPPSGVTWLPMEFLVSIDSMGLVGPPILTESSRVVSVDGYFQNYLVKTLHAGERLAPGFYRICVGP